MPTDRATVAVRPGPPNAVRPDGARRRGGDDAGLSLMEMVVALAIIGTVMTAMAPFLTQSMIVVREQRIEQVAVEITNDALERVRALKPSSLLVGRGANKVAAQWNARPAPVKKYDALLKPDSNDPDPELGATAALPTSPRDVTVSGQKYSQQWYVGRCWQPKADPAVVTAPVEACGITDNPAYVPFFRVVVAVTWSVPSSITRGPCVQGVCVYVATTLVSTGTDVIYSLKRPAPTVTTPANQIAYVSVLTSLQLAATGGWLPRTWAATGLPPGVSIAPGSGEITGTPTTVGSYPVTVLVTDRDKKTDDATFTWVVANLPVLTSPGDRIGHVGTAVTLPLTVTGGHPTMTWAATGLPAGLSINATTGVVSGTPTTAAAINTVKVTVTDVGKKAASVTLNWRVLTAVKVTDPGPQTFSSGTSAANFSLPVSGGLGPPYTWQAFDLPDGLTMSSAGVVGGTATNGTRYVVTAVATDGAGGTGTVVVVCSVTPRTGELAVTDPKVYPASKVNVTIASVTALANGASGSRAWTATGLPPGISISTAGVLTGTPTKAGGYIVRLTVRDSPTRLAHLMFTWTVT